MKNVKKESIHSSFVSCIYSIFALVDFSLFTKSMESWVTNWSNTGQSEILLNNIQEKSILEKFIELEEILFLDEMMKENSETHLEKLL
ncbi:hypothetical protein ACJIZ3_000521 [Penstemon smallii]|uniref:Uncharacterized protein n=1 Tax=Penstemon smallii TaxID=265156 RepID=A0ABD3R211_9LAMI